MARTRSNDYDKKRLGILARSAALFAQHGYTGTSITMIAEACGVSKALMYHYYTSKDAVLFDLLANHLRAVVRIAERAAASAPAGPDRLLAIVAALLQGYRGADAEHQVQISSLKLLPPAEQNVLKGIERELVDIVSKALVEASPALGARPDMVKPMTMTLFGMLNWLYMWFREGKQNGLSREAYARMVTTLLLSGAPAALAEIAPPAAAQPPRPVRTPQRAV